MLTSSENICYHFETMWVIYRHKRLIDAFNMIAIDNQWCILIKFDVIKKFIVLKFVNKNQWHFLIFIWLIKKNRPKFDQNTSLIVISNHIWCINWSFCDDVCPTLIHMIAYVVTWCQHANHMQVLYFNLPITIKNCIKAMCYCKDCAIYKTCSYCFLNKFVCIVINSSSSFIEYKNFRFTQKSPS